MLNRVIDLDPRTLVPAGVAGLIAAIIATIYAVSFAALVFAGGGRVFPGLLLAKIAQCYLEEAWERRCKTRLQPPFRPSTA